MRNSPRNANTIWILQLQCKPRSVRRAHRPHHQAHRFYIQPIKWGEINRDCLAVELVSNLFFPFFWMRSQRACYKSRTANTNPVLCVPCMQYDFLTSFKLIYPEKNQEKTMYSLFYLPQKKNDVWALSCLQKSRGVCFFCEKIKQRSISVRNS